MKNPTKWKNNNGTDTLTSVNDGFALLLETGFNILLETGDNLMLEASVVTPKEPTLWVEL